MLKPESNKWTRLSPTAPSEFTGRPVNRCTSCGTPESLTPDWTLWPWPDGAELCERCNDARHEVEEYP